MLFYFTFTIVRSSMLIFIISIFEYITNIFDYPNRSSSLPCVMQVGWREQFWEHKKGSNFSHSPLISSQLFGEKRNMWTQLIFISFLRSFDCHWTSEISNFHSFHSYPHFHSFRFTQNEHGQKVWNRFLHSLINTWKWYPLW